VIEGTLCIVGCGGHARSVADVALAGGLRSLLFVDREAREDETIFGFDVITPQRLATSGIVPAGYVIGLGDNAVRAQAFRQVCESGGRLTSVIAGDARIGRDVRLGVGVFVGMGAHIGPSARVGDDVIVNTRAIVEHEAAVGDHTHIAVNAVLLGRARIGSRGTLGAGAIVLDGVTVGDDVIVGAGAVVTRDIREPGRYAGVPARRLRD
jgi:sugar O-acyltransferase (sialic acid O-acetyltransferase NeuD family)